MAIPLRKIPVSKLFKNVFSCLVGTPSNRDFFFSIVSTLSPRNFVSGFFSFNFAFVFLDLSSDFFAAAIRSMFALENSGFPLMCLPKPAKLALRPSVPFGSA